MLFALPLRTGLLGAYDSAIGDECGDDADQSDGDGHDLPPSRWRLSIHDLAWVVTRKKPLRIKGGLIAVGSAKSLKPLNRAASIGNVFPAA
jgi:hypothetical protein